MKHVVKSSEVAHLWAHQVQDWAKNSSGSVSFRGDTIYSYSTPIARHLDGVVLFDGSRYSKTTSGHQGRIRYACSHLTRFDVFDVSASTEEQHEKNVTYMLQDAHANYEKAQHATMWGSANLLILADVDIEKADTLVEQARLYRDKFCPKFKNTMFNVVMFDSLRKRLKGAKELREERQAKQQRKYEEQRRKYEEQQRVNLERWVKGEDVRDTFYYLETRLRVKGDNVETSLGANVPITQGVILYKLAQKVKNDPSFKVKPRKIGHYQLGADSITSDGNVMIGCHNLTFGEMERIAKELNIA